MARGTWTPVDASGANLSFLNSAGVAPVGQWTTLENFVFCSFTLTYPATSDGHAAAIGGLPFPNGPDFVDLHVSSLSGGVTHWLILAGSTSVASEAAGAAAAKLNSDMSGKTISGTWVYRIS